MNTPAQQTTLDNALVSPDDRLKIGKCNMRIILTMTEKEPTYQVVLNALTLSPCYLTFLITADVLEIYMQQFWFTISKIKDSSSYKFQLDKKKCRIDVEFFRDILQICPRLPNQEFDEPPFDEEIMHDSPAYKTYLVFSIGVATPKKSRKWKKPASPSKNKLLSLLKNLSRNLLLENSHLVFKSETLLEVQMKKAIKRSKLGTHMHEAGGSGDGVGLEPEVPDEPKGKSINTHEGTGLKPGVPDVSKVDSSDSEYASWGISNDDDDDDDQQGDDERTESDDDKILDLNKKDDEEEI
ncbi:hypothetical protein Tco_1409088 [Tanacetum coccineum]